MESGLPITTCQLTQIIEDYLIYHSTMVSTQNVRRADLSMLGADRTEEGDPSSNKLQDRF